MQFYEYRGFTIYPAPQFIAGSGRWKVDVIVKYNNVIKKYGNDDVCFTKGEAVFHSIQYGRKLIDQGIVLLSEAV